MLSYGRNLFKDVQANLLMTSTPQITATEWRWAIKWSIAILLLSCLPYLFALQAAPEGWRFAGFLANPLDGHSYLAKIQQGEAGSWLFHLSYTPEPHEGVFVYTFYLALGHLAAATGLEKILVFHLARLLAGFGLLLAAFRFTARVLPEPQQRRLAFILMLTSAGLGWLGVVFGAFPIDLWVPEAFIPYSLYANPHFPLATMLMLIIFDQLLGSLTKPYPSVTRLFGVGLAALILTIISPFGLVIVMVVTGTFLSWLYLTERRLPWAQIWLTLDAILWSTPMLLYQYWVMTNNPAMAGWLAQNVTDAPALVDFGLGYGLVGLLALPGLIYIIRSGRTNVTSGQWLIVLWTVAAIALVYLPFDLQRRMIHGLHVPLSLLAAIGLSWGLAKSKLPAGYQHLTKVGVITLGTLGTLVVWGLPLISLLQAPESSNAIPLLFLREEEVAAFDWLREQVGPDEIILASPRLGMFVPGQTGARVFYGHPFETLEAEVKEAQVEAFYRGELESLSPAPDYLIYGPSERALGQPKRLAEYSPVFSAGELVIYKVSEDSSQ